MCQPDIPHSTFLNDPIIASLNLLIVGDAVLLHNNPFLFAVQHGRNIYRCGRGIGPSATSGVGQNG